MTRNSPHCLSPMVLSLRLAALPQPEAPTPPALRPSNGLDLTLQFFLELGLWRILLGHMPCPQALLLSPWPSSLTSNWRSLGRVLPPTRY